MSNHSFCPTQILEMCFLSFPRYVLLLILKEWIIASELCVLDSAVCNHKQRRTFLNHLNSITTTFKHNANITLTLNVVLWMAARKVSVDSVNLKIFTTMSNRKVVKIRKSNMSVLNSITAIEMTLQTKVQSTFTSLLRNANMLSKEDALPTNKALILTLIHCTAVQHLTMSNNNHMGDQTLLDASNTLHCLTSLTICGCSRLTAVGIQCLAIGNPGLVTLRLLDNPHVSGVQVCDVLSKSLPRISNLALTFSNSDSRAVRPSLTGLFATCTALTVLSTNSWDALLHAHEYLSLVDLEIAHVVIPYHSEVHWQSRTHLLSLCVCVKNMRDATASYIASTHPQLTALHITKSSEITNTAVHIILSHCTGLRRLTLARCPLISSGAMHFLSSSSPHCRLEFLDISHATLVTTEDILRLIRSCSALRQLVVTGCACENTEALTLAVENESLVRGGQCVVVTC